MTAIPASKLKGKHIEFYDKDDKYRIGTVVRVHKNSVVVSARGLRYNMRVPRERVIGQITHVFKRTIDWSVEG